MMLGLFCTGVEPFHTVYLHGLVRAGGGVKMGKTKGNTVDPLDVINEIGADALRFALIVGTSPGADQRLTSAKLEGARNFTNKLWNAARFVLGAQPEVPAQPGGDPTLAERWIRSRLAEATERATRQLDELELSAYAGTVHEFAWSDYCDWYLEMCKVDLRRHDATPGERARSWMTAAETLAGLLRLLHPIVPFVSEQIWSALHEAAPAATRGEPMLIRASWPSAGPRDPGAEADMQALVDLVRAVRNLRTDAGVAASAWLPLTIVPTDAAAQAAIGANLAYLEALAHVRPIDLRTPGQRESRPALVASSPAAVAWLGSDARADAEALARRRAEVTGLREGIDRLSRLLAGPFADRAPASVVARERERLAELEAQLRQLSGDA